MYCLLLLVLYPTLSQLQIDHGQLKIEHCLTNAASQFQGMTSMK